MTALEIPRQLAPRPPASGWTCWECGTPMAEAEGRVTCPGCGMSAPLATAGRHANRPGDRHKGHRGPLDVADAEGRRILSAVLEVHAAAEVAQRRANRSRNALAHVLEVLEASGEYPALMREAAATLLECGHVADPVAWRQRYGLAADVAEVV